MLFKSVQYFFSKNISKLYLPIVVSQNFSSATSGARLAPIKTEHSIPKEFLITSDIN